MGSERLAPLPPADPLQEQLQQLQQRVQAVLPQVERLTCERVDGPAQQVLPLYDSCPLQHCSSSVLLPLSHNGSLDCVVGFHASGAAAFSEAKQATLEALAELIGLTVHSHFLALASLDAAAQLAHEFAALRDFETGSHLNRVAQYARQIAESLAERHGLSPLYVEQIGRFSRFHDIGKIGIPDAVLLKQGPLTPEERLVMDSHVNLGLAMIEKVLNQHALLDQPGAEVLRNLIGHHHERLDGSGYPNGLRGDEISLEGRIIAVADVFDAITNTRPYRQGLTVPQGLAELEDLAAAGQLDGECVSALVGLLRGQATSGSSPFPRHDNTIGVGAS